jgi:DNA-binding response OmpR family regulator
MKKKVLIIEDEKPIARFLQLEFEYEGYEVIVVHEGRAGIQKAQDETPDLIILDVMLPDLSGLEVCRRIRQHLQVPIIMLTARDSVPDRVSGLDAGADDYITKPFAIEELLARVRAIERRNHMKEEKWSIRVGDVEIFPMERRVICHETVELSLTTREFDLLLFLLKNKNRVCTRESILEQVWGYNYSGDTNVVDVYIRYLRNKLSQAKVEHLIETVRGVGYVVREH